LYRRARRPLTLGVKGLVCDKQGHVLLVKHAYQPGWHLPGGKVERGETLAESIERELREETGLDCRAVPKRLLGIYANFNEFKYDHVAVFVIEGVDSGRLKAPWFEIEDCRFFPLAALPEHATQATRKRIDEYLGKIPVGPQW